MIKIENTEVFGWKAAIRGMRNPMNSWDKSDSLFLPLAEESIGKNDLKLMTTLSENGPVHSKYLRMINVTMDITAPLYWWKEFDTYKVGTVANSCSTMHKIHAKEFELDDFSHDHLSDDWDDEDALVLYNSEYDNTPQDILEFIVDALNRYRISYFKTKDKKYWWQMIQLLPSSYNQRRTIQLNYAVLQNMYQHRKEHKLDEWREFCKWIQTLPHSELITLKRQ